MESVNFEKARAPFGGGTALSSSDSPGIEGDGLPPPRYSYPGSEFKRVNQKRGELCGLGAHVLASLSGRAGGQVQRLALLFPPMQPSTLI